MLANLRKAFYSLQIAPFFAKEEAYYCYLRDVSGVAKTIVVHDEHYLCVLIFPWVLQLLQKIHHEFRKNVPGNFLCAVDCQEALVILELCLMINAPEDTLIILLDMKEP